MKYTHFSKEERAELSILKKKGYSLRSIAEAMGKSHSSLSRELRRNTVHGLYDPKKAHHKAYVKRKYSKYQGMKVSSNPEIQNYVKEKMEVYGWSPSNIAGRFNVEKGLKLLGKDAIYKYLYSARGQFLCHYLKYKRYGRRHRIRSKSIPAKHIPHRISIDLRPQEINERTTFGHFEADTMGKPRNASAQTLVVMRERLSRKLFGIKVKKLKYTIKGFKKIVESIPVVSITFDNGVENIRYRELGIPSYFCNPYHSWEKGSVEQGIGLIREYIPKKADLKYFSQEKIDAILEKINNTPMKCLNYKTPNEVYSQNLLFLNQTSWCTSWPNSGTFTIGIYNIKIIFVNLQYFCTITKIYHHIQSDLSQTG
jgi:IS30 family transposase